MNEEEERYLLKCLNELSESGIPYNRSSQIITDRLDEIVAEEIMRKINEFRKDQ